VTEQCGQQARNSKKQRKEAEQGFSSEPEQRNRGPRGLTEDGVGWVHGDLVLGGVADERKSHSTYMWVCRAYPGRLFCIKICAAMSLLCKEPLLYSFLFSAKNTTNSSTTCSQILTTSTTAMNIQDEMNSF
jgi:hypothetical protein